MSSDQTWVEALKISPESLSDWSMQAPSGTPLLVWCMVNGHVPAEDYLAWAHEHFGLAVLDSRFFKEAFRSESLNQVRDQAPWSPWCFPVGEWDDVTFVACAEPPSDMPEGRYAFVLADPNAMKEAWGDHGTHLMQIEAPVGISAKAAGTFVLNLDSGVMKMPEPAEEKSPAPLNTPPPPPPAAAAPVAAKVTPSVDVDLGAVFERLHETFQSAMIMRCSEGVASPYKWDPQLPVENGSPKFNVNLNYPSFLRIVAKTVQPYHGYVIDSPAHREFFENLKFSNLPACVTAVPLKTGEKLWGMMIAFGGEGAQTPEALNEALAVGEKLHVTLGLNKLKAA